MIKKGKVVYVDESGIEDTIYQKYGWSERGVPILCEIKGRRTHRRNMIAGLRKKKLLAPLVFDCSIDSECFNYWLKHHLLRRLSPGYTIVMDNARFHLTKKTKKLIRKAKCYLIFLPTYSPDLNPIENWWAIIKSRVRRVIHQFDDFDLAINHVLSVS